MFKKLFYSSVIVSNINNIKCGEKKISLVKYVLNNTSFIGCKNLKLKLDEIKIKNIAPESKDVPCGNWYNDILIDHDKDYLPHSQYDYEKNVINLFHPEKGKENKLEFAKLEIKEKDKPSVFSEGDDYKNNKQNEVVKENTDYIFYYNCDYTIPKNTLNIKYKNIKYSNENEIKIEGKNFKENKDYFSNFIDLISSNMTDGSNNKLSDVIKVINTPFHVTNCKFKEKEYNKIEEHNEESFYYIFLYDVLYNNFKGVEEMEIDDFFKYRIVLRCKKGYYVQHKQFTKLKEVLNRRKTKLTKKQIKEEIKNQFGLTENCYDIEVYDFKAESVVEKKDDEDIDTNTDVIIKFDVNEILKQKGKEEFVKNNFEKWAYKHKIIIMNNNYGRRFKMKKFTDNSSEPKDGAILNENDLKAKIKEYFDLEEDQYNILNKDNIKYDETSYCEVRIEIKKDFENKFFEEISKNEDKKNKEINNKTPNESQNTTKEQEKCCCSN